MTKGSKYQKIKEKLSPEQQFSLEEAINFLKENKASSFDESIEIHLNLGINTKKTEQTVKGNIVLPYGGFSKKRIVAFVEPEKEKEAMEADLIGGKELIDKIAQSKKMDFDIAVATPVMMKELVKLAKILGPKGLMPSPKAGTITTDIKEVIGELKRGKISFKNDDGGNIHQIVGKISWEKEKILANIKSFLDAVKKSRPGKVKEGSFINSVTICSTMGPGLKIRI